MPLYSVPIRVLVTGTRAKSSLVRLLHAALCTRFKTWSRITGVLPRELSPLGTRVVNRNSPASFREMRWWLEQIPADAEAVVMENSAVSPDLQSAAASWMRPNLVVWTTLRADHEDAWGFGVESAARALIMGVPNGVPVVAGREVEQLRSTFEALGCETAFAENSGLSFRESNLKLAAAALEALGVRSCAAVFAMMELEPDVADFRVIGEGDDLLASAFSANDVESTDMLFRETGWNAGDTTLLYHHRPDRMMRLRGFLAWIRSLPWRQVVFTRNGRSVLDLNKFSRALNWHDDIRDPSSFEKWRRARGKIFACGNVAGWPLEYLINGSRVHDPCGGSGAAPLRKE